MHIYSVCWSAFTARCTIVLSAVLRLHVVRHSVCLSVRLSVLDVGGSVLHRLEILKINCMDFSPTPYIFAMVTVRVRIRDWGFDIAQ